MHQTLLNVSVGDVVIIDLNHPLMSHKDNFEAEVTEVHDRLSINPAIKYRRLDGQEDDHSICDVSYVTKIVRKIPYVVQPHRQVNIFRGHFDLCCAKEGGLRSGPFPLLLKEALVGITHVDLVYPIHDYRAWEMFDKAGYRGKVLYPDDDLERRLGIMTVRWKTFKHWVYQNAERLIESRTEARTRMIQLHRAFQEEMIRDIEADMDLLEGLDKPDDGYGEPMWLD